ncbi:HAD-IA family hydrolase [Aurantivibrio infirmus]
MSQCIIFDCDGTLVDSEYLCNLGLEIKLRDYGVKESACEMMARFRGGKLTTILESLEDRHQIKLADDFVSSYRALVDALFEEQLQPCEGVSKMLAEISLPKCVASSGPLNKINKALNLTALSGYFNGHIFSSYEVGSWKPDPGIFLHAAKVMGYSPHNCVVVEDSPVGIAAAQRAEMKAILYDPAGIHSNISGVCKINHMCELSSAIT